MSPEELAQRVAASCAASGVPVHVADALAIERIAALLRTAAGRPRARARRA